MQAYAWLIYAQMAVHTASGFLILFGVQSYKYLKEFEDEDGRYLAILVTLLFFTTFLVVGFKLKDKENNYIHKVTTTDSEIIESKINLKLEQDLQAFKRLSSRMSYQKKLDFNFWKKDATDYVKDFGFYQALEWSDSDHIIKEVMPIIGNEKALEMDLKKNSLRFSKIEEARKKGELKITNSVDLLQGGQGILVYYPIYIKNEFHGTSIGVVRIQNLFDKILAHINFPQFVFRIKENGQVIYSSMDNREEFEEKAFVYKSDRISKFVTGWSVEITPKSEYVNDLTSVFPEVILVIGFIFSILLGSIIYFSKTNQFLSKRVSRSLIEQKTLNSLLLIPSSTHITLNEKLEQVINIVLDIPWIQVLSKAGIFLREKDILKLFISRNLGPNIEKLCKTVECGSCLCGTAFKENRIVHAECVDQRHTVRFEGMKPHGHYNIPLRDENKEVLGVMVLYLNHGHKYNEDEKRFLETCSEIISNIILNHRKEEILIKTKEEAILAEKTKSAFLANMSHEIRTPMNGIVGMAEIMMSESVDQEMLDKLGIISSSAHSLLLIINDILDFSKIEAGKLLVEKINFNLNRTISQQIDLFKVVASKKGLLIHHFIDKSVPEFIISDEIRLKQIINNLISNAIKFTEKGEIKLLVYLDEVLGDQLRLRFKIIDSGIGISPENIQKLFKDFSQVDESTTRRFGGTGLGLSISKKLVNMLGGDIHVTSVEGEGTTFSFDIICKLGESFLVKESGRSTLEIKHIKDVLIVDDNTINQTVARTFLQKYGFTIDIADNGQVAVDKVKENYYDVVFMDCHMPVMDGFEATKNIIKILGDKRPYIVALTASAMKEDVEKCYKCGMDNFISKPVTNATLQKLLIQVEEDLAAKKKES